MSRKTRTAWFVFVGFPALAVVFWLVLRSEPSGRGMLVLDVPSEVSVTIDERAVKPCRDEYKAPPSCSQTPTPGFARRYAWSVIRGSTVEVMATLGARNGTVTIDIPADGAVPHLRVDGETLEWKNLGGVVAESGVLVFIDADGNRVGPLGPSAPD